MLIFLPSLVKEIFGIFSKIPPFFDFLYQGSLSPFQINLRIWCRDRPSNAAAGRSHALRSSGQHLLNVRRVFLHHFSFLGETCFFRPSQDLNVEHSTVQRLHAFKDKEK